MLKVNVAITNISAERFWDLQKPIPPIQIGTNINVISIERKKQDTLKVPFVLSINYNPSISQINLKGSAYVVGEPKEIEKILKNHEQKKPPPPVIVQSIANFAFIESVLISRTLNIPPPIPLPKIPNAKNRSRKNAEKEYTT
ncbi:MAG: hypothetical protein NWF10_01145 [Candidatus Bathyarchaeota archaeon]|jgi:hypothetical protein|nr:hypothetical protein [Candidatus Bathyarchaeota archaeon]